MGGGGGGGDGTADSFLTFVGGVVTPAACKDLFLSTLVEAATSVLLLVAILELWLGEEVDDMLLGPSVCMQDSVLKALSVIDSTF